MTKKVLAQSEEIVINFWISTSCMKNMRFYVVGSLVLGPVKLIMGILRHIATADLHNEPHEETRD